MKILIAEDDPISRRLLHSLLAEWGYEVSEAVNGVEALAQLGRHDAPSVAVLDWIMPELDGLEVCRQVRSQPVAVPTYLILLTARDRKEDIVHGLDAGANDYVTKPFDREELRARVRVGFEMVRLQKELAAQVQELREALVQVKQLHGLLPICCYCKKIRDDKNYWQQVESYISHHADVRFSHGICPECFETRVKPELEEAQKRW